MITNNSRISDSYKYVIKKNRIGVCLNQNRRKLKQKILHTATLSQFPEWEVRWLRLIVGPPLHNSSQNLMGKNLIFQRVVIHFHHSHPAAPPHVFAKAVNWIWPFSQVSLSLSPSCSPPRSKFITVMAERFSLRIICIHKISQFRRLISTQN